MPLRAISEGLDCTVDWSADTKTVDIQKKQGQYAVSSAHISKNITDDKGNILITIAFEYPVIENKDNNAFITAVTCFLSHSWIMRIPTAHIPIR